MKLYLTELLISALLVAIATIYRAVVAGRYRNFAFLAAVCTDSVVHCSGASLTAAVFTGIAAILAALRFVGKAFFSIELLLSGSKGKVLSAFGADKGFVFKHG